MNEQTVRELVESGLLRVEDGNHGEYRPRPDEFVEEGVSYIRAADMTSGVIDFKSAGKISQVARERIRKGIGNAGDVILSHKGTVGRVAVAPPNSPEFVCSPQTTFWRSLDASVLDQQYLMYFMCSANFLRQLDVLKGQTDMAPYVSLTDQRSIVLQLPPITQQRGIAEVLGALDDKIAANGRVGRLAEELADAKFREAVEGIPFADNTFADLADVGGGGTPKTTVEEFWGGQVAWATPTDVTGLDLPYLSTTSRTITEDGLGACASALYPPGSILMTSRATIGAFAIAELPMAVNQGFIVVNAFKPNYQWWLYHEMRSRIPEFLSHANGATFLELSRGRFKVLPVRLAHDGVIARFSAEVDKLHKLAAQVQSESRTLAKTRDELLPLLMSGKLRVKDAEQVVEEIA
ncbi:MAG: restriction endonuclease subunit S [Nocardia sp.]|nr:restriction endonuclease subunit S [Nocardia sp.]